MIWIIVAVLVVGILLWLILHKKKMNFDTRLPLPFPFYDDLDKQAHRTWRCWRETKNLAQWQILTDNRHLPPFEVMVDSVCSGSTSGTMILELYDVHDNYVANLEDEYSIITSGFIELKSSIDHTWVIHDGDTLSKALPSGMHYIKMALCDEVWYSEIVNICDCTVITEKDISEGVQVIENYSFTDWTGDLPDHWDTNEAAPFITFDQVMGVDTCEVFADDGFSAIIGQANVLTIGHKYHVVISVGQWADGTATTSGFQDDIVITAAGNYTFDSVADSKDFSMSSNTSGNSAFYIYYISILDITDEITYQCPDQISLAYWNECDLGNIIYQTGYKNLVYFQSPKIDLSMPSYEITKDTEMRDGERLVYKTTMLKTHNLVFLAPEYMADAMSILDQHDNIWMQLSCCDYQQVQVGQIDIKIERFNSCFFKITLSFVIDPMIKGSCCNDFTLL